MRKHLTLSSTFRPTRHFYSLLEIFRHMEEICSVRKHLLFNTVKPEYNDNPRDPKIVPLLTGGRCSEVILCNDSSILDHKMMVVVGRWSLFGGGR
jgi:hypothetical protein